MKGQHTEAWLRAQRERDEKIAALRRSGLSIEATAKEIGVSTLTAQRACKRTGTDGVMAEQRYVTQDLAAFVEAGKETRYQQKTEEEIAEWIAGLGIHFSYAGGYTGSEGTVLLKCDKCGEITQKSCVALRHGKGKICAACTRRKREEAEAQRKRETAEKMAALEKQRAEARARKEAEREAKSTKACIVCGKIFKSESGKITCSPECKKERDNERHQLKHRKRLDKMKIIDKGITAKALYKRDGGVCYLCGRPCRLDDYIIRDGAFIAGDFYPSVDHVVPINKGGVHSWENVRLAHRSCNSAKHDKIVRPG